MGGKAYTFHPSVVTSFDVRTLEMGAKIPVAYDESDPTSADIAEPWRMYAGPVVVTLLYAVFAYYAFLG